MSVVLPGDTVKSTRKTHPDHGTHIRESQIAASLAGSLRSARDSVSVDRLLSSPTLPTINSTVIGRVLRLRPREANLSIQIIDGDPVTEPFSGIIRLQDIRATEKDKIRIADSFRVGDVVRATVISLGDERNYYCSTARNELGVIMAASEGGEALFAVSWKEMKDASGRSELRKVAKPD